MDFSVFRIALFNFRLLFAPANCLEIIQQIRDFRGDLFVYIFKRVYNLEFYFNS